MFLHRKPCDKKYQNWMDAHLAVKITKEGIEHFVYDEIERFQQNCLIDICNNNGLPAGTTCSSCCTENVVVCPTNRICNARRGKCNFHINSATQFLHSGCPNKICHNFKSEIQGAHRFYSPSYKNTDASQWCSNPWEVAKCFLPPDGYRDVTSAAETHFDGVISVLINYKAFQSKVKDDLSKMNNIFVQCRQISRAIKNCPTLEVEDAELRQYFKVLRKILTEPADLASDKDAQIALRRLAELESDHSVVMQEIRGPRINNASETGAQSMEIKHHNGNCEVCKQDGELILCATCPRCYHASCLKSESKEIAVDNWLCPICITWRNDIEDIERFRTAQKHQPKGKLPKEILEMDSRSIDIYRQALKEGEYHAHHIRVMIVGHYGVGKTTLTKRLFGDEVDIGKRESTDGIDVHVGRCKVSMNDGTWQVHGKQTDKDIERSTLFHRLASVLHATAEEATDQADNKELVDASSSTVIYQTEEMSNRPEEPMKKKARRCEENKPEHIDLTKNDSYIREMKHLKAFIEHVQKDIDEENEDTSDLSLWDFAGQNEFYDTHQAFLSRRAIYLLVVDISANIDDILEEDSWISDCQGERKCAISDFVDFWLNSIHEFCSGSDEDGPTVILVGTFADKMKENISVENAFVPLLTSIADKVTSCHLAEESFLIDNTIEDERVDSLRRYIFKVAKDQHHWGEPVPVKWITLEEILLGLKEEKVKILSKKKLKEFNATLPVPIGTDDELETFLEFHHKIGNILYYSKGILQEYILLDPQWLIDAFKSLITARMFCIKLKDVRKHWMEFDKTAVLKPCLIEKIWSREENTGFLEHKEILLNYMEVLGYITKPRHQNEETNSSADFEQTPEYYFVPCKLKETAQREVTASTDSPHCKFTSKLCFTTSKEKEERFIPKTSFNRFFANCLNKWPLSIQNKKTMIFCGGAVFCLEKNHFLYIFLYEHVIQMWISRLSMDGQSPEHSVCLKTKDCVTSMLKENVKINSHFVLFVKCPEASLNYDEMMLLFEEESNVYQQQTVCYCHEKEHVLVYEDLIKYWSHNLDMHFKSRAFGEFIDTRGTEMTALEFDVVAEATRSICIIEYPILNGWGNGTGFRVGKKYIMTAAHVAKEASDGDLGESWARFNYKDDRKCRMEDIYTLKGVVYSNKETDIAVIELEDKSEMPQALLKFITPVERFYLIGHSQKQVMKVNQVTKVFTEESNPNLNDEIVRTRELSAKHTQALSANTKVLCEIHPFDMLDNKDRFLFHCTFTKGASGSPGIVIMGKSIYVTTVLLHGYPDWYYNPKYESLKSKWPMDECIEQGANMQSVCRKMRTTQPELCKEIFGTCIDKLC